jgi:membrane peptidoglycan carboxypeptidase
MQTSLMRRQRRRRNGSLRRSGGGGRGALRAFAIGLPLLLFGSFVTLGLAGLAIAVVAYNNIAAGLPDPVTTLDNVRFSQQTVVFDRTGQTELARFGSDRREVVTFDEIPPELIDATTAIEDKTFWDNAGFDFVGIVSAAISTIGGNERGASTITQQLVRQLLLPEEVLAGSRYERKVKEIVQAVRLTQELLSQEHGSVEAAKQRIMTYYLNTNYYGNQSYGVAAAAQSYFGKELKDLTLAQAAILAGIPQAPSQYDLVKNAVEECTVALDAEGACPPGKSQLVVPADSPIVQRRNYILELMKTRSVLSGSRHQPADYERAKREPVILAPQTTPLWLAPHFVWQVRHDLGAILCGTAQADSCPAVDSGGYRVVTTIDLTMQQTAERWLKAAVIGAHQKDRVAYLKQLGVPDRPWIAKLRGATIHNGAMAAIDYRTGDVLAYVGSADYYAPKATKQFQPKFDVLADGWRQPGSAFKPITYITGIDDRILTAATAFMDVVTDFGGGYTPTDADRLERGPLRLRQALQFSLNIPAIKAAAIIGPDHVFANARRFGIEFQQDRNVAGVSIAIGTLEVHPIDLLSAYGAIANGGVLMPRRTILQVSDASGNRVWPTGDAPPTGEPVASPQAAYIITDILAGNTNPSVNPYWGQARLTDGGRRRPAALKTGTTNDTKDLMSVGYVAPPEDPKAPAIAALVWMGNSDNSPAGGLFSLEAPTPLWQEFMNRVTKGTPIVDFPRPRGIVEATVDAFSGMLPGPFSTKTVKEVFIAGTAPTQVDTTKMALDVDAATGLLWQDGCAGPKETRGFLNPDALVALDAAFPSWQRYDEDWIRRAQRGPGVAGGPKKTRTSYFYNNSFRPYGATWGAPWPPTETCPIVLPSPSPPPSCDPNLGPCPSPGASPEPVAVGTYVCLTAVQAAQEVAAAGLQPVLDPPGAGADWKVVGQSPAPGTSVPPGSTVVLQLKKPSQASCP